MLAPAAIASFALMAPVGLLLINPGLQAIGTAADAARPGPLDRSLLARTYDPLLTGALLSLTTWLIGIVLLMTTKWLTRRRAARVAPYRLEWHTS